MIFPHVKGIEECFELGKELVTYEFGNFPQLAELIQYYYANPDERQQIRRAGHARTRRDHTYRNRMESMLEVLQAEGALL